MIEGSRCPERIAEISSISLTLGREMNLLKLLLLLVSPAGITHTKLSPEFYKDHMQES